MGLCLRAELCYPHHICHHCGTEADYSGNHGLSYQCSKGYHHDLGAINDIVQSPDYNTYVYSIWHRFELNGIACSDVKRPGGVRVVSWKKDKLLLE